MNTRENTREITYGWACSDCTMLVANGETPPELDEEATEEYLANIARRAEETGVTYWSSGGEHDEDCANMVDGVWVGDTDCYCETLEFSSVPCIVCGSRLAGSRDAVFSFLEDTADEADETPSTCSCEGALHYTTCWWIVHNDDGREQATGDPRIDIPAREAYESAQKGAN